MYCSSCGKKITENSKFCKYCGASQIETEGKEEKKTNKEYYETVWTCDFCKEEFKSKEESDSHELKCIQNPKNKKFLQNINPKRAWEYLWLTTVLVFFINMSIGIKYGEFNIELLNGKFLNTLFFSNIGLGVFSFLALIVSRNKPKNNKVSMFVKYSLIICFFYLLINSLVFAVEGNSAKNDESYRNKYYAGTTPTPVPTVEVKITPTVTSKKTVKVNNGQNTNQGSQIDCIGPDGVQFKATMEECKKLNETWGKPVDYMVNCNYSDLCANGGGIKYVKKSECDKPCAPKSDTTNRSSQITTGNNSNKTAVYITSWNTTYYCPPELVDGVKTADLQHKTARDTKSDCDNEAYTTYSSCRSNCVTNYYSNEEKLSNCYILCDNNYDFGKKLCENSYKIVENGFMDIIKKCSSYIY